MKYLKYLVVPLAALLILAAQMTGLLLRGELPVLKVEVEARDSGEEERLAAFLDATSRRAGVATLAYPHMPASTDLSAQTDASGNDASGNDDFRNDDSRNDISGDIDLRNGEADILVIDLPFKADPDPKPVAGTFDERLDAIRGRTLAGLQTVIGFSCLSGTENPPLAQELGAWTGAGQPAWVGWYLPDLSDTGRLPEPVPRAWEAANGRSWDHRGAGIVLQAPTNNTVVVLRRGTELDRNFLSVRGQAAGIRLDSLLGSSFAILKESGKGRVLASAAFGFLPAGQELAAAYGIPAEFPLVIETPYGLGSVWTLALDLLEAGSYRSGLSLYPSPGWEAARTLDEPSDSYARFARLAVPIWRALNLVALERKLLAVGRRAAAGRTITRFRAGSRYLEREDSNGNWQPWFVKGVNLGPTTPGHWFGAPPTDEASYTHWLAAMAQAGFDTIRLYTLLPPAFYRALAAWNLAAEEGSQALTAGSANPYPGSTRVQASGKVLYLIQEIWPDEEAPGHDLGDPAYLRAYLEESARTISAVFGRADIPARQFRAWGQYRADVSPWLAAVLVGRELLPEEVIATAQARPDESFSGDWFAAAPGHPVESILALMADLAAGQIANLGGQQVPVGFVSWPTLDTLYHPAEWPAGSDSAPYNDRASVDFRAISTRPGNQAGFFTAYHIYPNYPDFMIRSATYEVPGDKSGYLRYAAYIEDLLSTQKGIPLLVTEFGLATGYGTAHAHPEGLDHGGLSEAAQAAGLVGLYRAIAGSGAGGGIVFQWADEWAKKTWTTETYMIPYDRNPLWHNTIDPEQNYGIMAWVPHSTETDQVGRPTVSASPEPAMATSSKASLATSSKARVESWIDPVWLYLQVAVPEAGPVLDPEQNPVPDSGQNLGQDPVPDEGKDLVLDLGLDLVPGRTGEYRLYPGGPLAPQGSEFVLRARLRDGQLQTADLLVYPDYNRGGGRLYPGASDIGGYTRILSLVNGRANTREGRAFASIWEDGSTLPTGPSGLATIQPDGKLLFRLPWSRLNFSDPSQKRILLDPVRDARAVLTHDSLATLVIDSIGVWAHFRIPGRAPHSYIPGREQNLRLPLQGWEDVQATLRPKLAHSALTGFLPGWDALDEPAIQEADLP